MKKINKAILISSLIAIISLAVLFSVYASKKKSIEFRLPSNANVLFIGDSYTASNTSYADQLKSLYPGINITKVAKVGATTDWMLLNLKTEIQPNIYDAVFVLGGVNDIYAKSSISGTKSNIAQMASIIKENGSIPIIITSAPTDYYTLYNSTKGNLTKELNTWILGNSGFNSFDIYSILSDNSGKQQTQLFASDHLHPNAQGNILIAKAIGEKYF